VSAALEPFYLRGDSGIYCCLHGKAASGRTGVLCVQPLFGEYIQHHRAFFLLAERLARRRIPCLRYDHHGTGDSAGDLPEASVSRWTRDIEAMSAALVQAAGVEHIVIVGARFGATLALGAAARVVRSVGLALWEPCWSGSAFLDSLVRTDRESLAPYVSPDHASSRGDSRDVLGFEIPSRLWNEIAAFDPDGDSIAPDLDVLVAGSAVSVEGSARLYGHERLSLQSVEYPRGWLDPERGMYDVLVPAEALGHLARWIEARA